MLNRNFHTYPASSNWMLQIKRNIPDWLKKPIKRILYKGDKVFCPFCKFRAKGLMSVGYDIPVLVEKKVVGGGRRDNACYMCGSTDRERLIYSYLKHEYKIFSKDKNLKVLHIAPEYNIAKIFLDNNFKNYVAGDLFTEGYSYPKYVRNMNLLNLPFSDNSFDLIICNHVLEHIINDLDAMNEIFRTLNKGGKAILQVPISMIEEETFEDFSIVDATEREKMFGQYDHVRIYGQNYPLRLKSVGFLVRRLNISEEYKEFGLNKDEDLFIVEK